MTGPAELDDVGQEFGKLAMRTNMMFGQLAEHDARRREAKARRAAQQDQQAAKTAHAQAQAARAAATAKLHAVLHPQWSEHIKDRPDRDDIVVDAARIAHNFQGTIPTAAAALAKIQGMVENEHGVPLEQWKPTLTRPPANDIEDAQTASHDPNKHSTVGAAAAVDALDRRDNAEERSDRAEGQARASAAEAEKARADARATEADAGLTRLPEQRTTAGTTGAEPAPAAAKIGRPSPGAAAAVTPGFSRAIRTLHAAFPHANTPTVTRATAPQARKGRGTGPAQGRTRDLGL